MRSLVLACSLLLALPQGWCCMFACCPQVKATTSTATAETKDIPGDVGGCCGNCPHQSNPSHGSTDKPTPAKKPSAPTNSVCSCADRHATLPAASPVEQVDTGLVLFLPPLAIVAPGVGHRAGFMGTDTPPPTRPLHVLNCVWLC